MTKRIIQLSNEDNKRHQIEMAKNIGKLSSKAAQKRQASLLCQSLVKMIKGGSHA